MIRILDNFAIAVNLRPPARPSAAGGTAPARLLGQRDRVLDSQRLAPSPSDGSIGRVASPSSVTRLLADLVGLAVHVGLAEHSPGVVVDDGEAVPGAAGPAASLEPWTSTAHAGANFY